MFFFFNDTATTEIYTLSLHDALPISESLTHGTRVIVHGRLQQRSFETREGEKRRSEEHTSELQSRQYLVCRLLLEKKKQKTRRHRITKPKNCSPTHRYTRHRAIIRVS